jgi:hypothetical protein
MNMDSRPSDGVGVQAHAKSFLSVFLSILFVIPTGVSWPVSVEALTAGDKDKKAKPDVALKGLPITELSADEAILHALNRLAYGPRPGDVERVRQMGLAKWIEQQLNPNAIEDRAAEARLEQFPTLRMSTAKRCQGGAESGGAGFPWRADSGYYGGDARETVGESADRTGEIGRYG